MRLSKTRSGTPSSRAGFTLVEVMIALAVSAVSAVVMVWMFTNLQQDSLQQVEISMMQQNLRGVLNIMEREMRDVGRDVNQATIFGVTDIRRYGITQPGTAATPDGAAGVPILQFTADLNDNRTIDGNETITYLLFDRDGDPANGFDLARSQTSTAGSITNRQILAEGIVDMSFAYAFDQDDNGRIDRAVPDPPAPPGPPAIIWAVDRNNDGFLDRTMDGQPLIGKTTSEGVTIRANVSARQIRAVQVWILTRTDRPDRHFMDMQVYSLGDRIVDPKNPANYTADLRHWMLTEVIHLRNRL